MSSTPRCKQFTDVQSVLNPSDELRLSQPLATVTSAARTRSGGHLPVASGARAALSGSPGPTETSVIGAIETAPLSALRNILCELVRNNPSAEVLISQRLTTPIAGSVNPKRKLNETCMNCKQDYRVTENAQGSCVYHPGKCKWIAKFIRISDRNPRT